MSTHRMTGPQQADEGHPGRALPPRLKILAAVACAAVMATGVSLGAADAEEVAARMEIQDLPVCYALGTDAIGRAVTAPSSGADLDSTAAMVDPSFKEGLAHYRRCFAPSFTFTLSNRGSAGQKVPNPATRTQKTDATLQWANFVNRAFRGSSYVYTQHHMGSISSEVRGNEGTIESYVIATHAYGPASKATGVSVVYGTYTDKVVKIDGKWLIAERTLDIWSGAQIP